MAQRRHRRGGRYAGHSLLGQASQPSFVLSNDVWRAFSTAEDGCAARTAAVHTICKRLPCDV